MKPGDIDRTDGNLPQKELGSLNPIPAKSMQEQRRLQIERLAAGFRLFALYGFDEGLAGHITLRDPEFKDHFWVNPLGMNFKHISVSDLLLVKEDGTIIQGDRPINPAAFYIHSSIHIMSSFAFLSCMTARLQLHSHGLFQRICSA